MHFETNQETLMPEDFDRELLRTVHLVPLTAFDSAGRIAEDVQAEHTSKMYAAGIRCFLPAAGTSEFQSLSADEVVELVRITRAASGPDALVFAPVGLQIGHAIDVGKRSMEAGATGLMFMPFCHPYLSDEGARDYYHAVIDQVPCPTLVYKKGPIPSNDLLLELADHPHVVGVKYAVNEMHSFRKVVLADGDRVEWLCGSAERFAPFYMLAGSKGYTTGAGNLCPHLTLAAHAAFMAGEFEEGLRYQQLILPIEDYRAREGDSYNISMLKFAMSLIGKEFGPPRPPQRILTAAEQTEITQLMGPILAAESEMASELTSVGLSTA
jgi:4-hydroxy-tetrahydrodipicolinate synthase